MKQDEKLSVLRNIALAAAVAGACGSVGFVLYAGRHNGSFVLVSLFVIWVLSPFAALLAVNVLSKRWPANSRLTIYITMIVLTLSSLVIYSGMLTTPGTKATGMFLIVPLLSWVVMGVVVLVIRRRAGRILRGGKSA